MKTIKQLSSELGISKEAIYKKLKFQLKDELTGHVLKIDNITRVDEEGERLIRQSLHHERREALETLIDDVIDAEVVELNNGQNHLSEYVDLLKEQVKAKDIQIETQSCHIGQLIRQLGINQMIGHNRRLNELTQVQAGRHSNGVKPVKSARRKETWRRIFKKRGLSH